MTESAQRLLDKFKDRNLKEELAWCANYTHKGYMSKANAEFYSWVALAALQRIRELEGES